MPVDYEVCNRINVAGVLMDIHPDNLWVEYGTFVSDEAGREPDVSVRCVAAGSIKKPAGKIVSDGHYQWIAHADDQHRISVAYSRANEFYRPEVLVSSTREWKNVSIKYKDNCSQTRFDVGTALGAVVFASKLLFLNGLVIHASAIKLNGRAIVLSAPSGTGKSTQAKLWATHRGVTILNDDTPCLRVENGEVQAYGTPWCGSKNIFVNDSAPVSAIVVLEQGKENVVRKLSAEETVSRFLPRCFLPYHDTQFMKAALAIFEKVISRVPVYLYSCRPDSSAVDYLEEQLAL